MKRLLLASLWLLALPAAHAAPSPLSAAIAKDYTANLAALADHFHRNPELSFMEVQTAKRLAAELRKAGFEVTEGVGKTGVVAIMKNGPGPMIMVRADMDGLPVEEKSGLPNASKVIAKDPNGRDVSVAHACGHDIHMTSLVGTAHQMAARKSEWSGTLMLIGQPAEERLGGARDMTADALWKRFGQPDMALALHVMSDLEAGKIDLDDAPWSGSNSVEILVRGVGTHGASPHTGKDPIVIGAQIVLALQAVVARDLAPREPGLITVGAFHAGSKSNIIGDSAKLELTVRSESVETRDMLLAAIKRVALNQARSAGVEENMLPEVTVIAAAARATLNDVPLSRRLRKVWTDKLGGDIISTDYKRLAMVAEDFSGFTTSPYIPSVYFKIGGTPAAELDAARKGGPVVAYNHSPLFKVAAEPAIRSGVEVMVVALLDLLKK
ncbi:MAG: amidohydrolase [Pseudomonadota bacterium]